MEGNKYKGGREDYEANHEAGIPFGEWTRKLMGMFEMPLLLPVNRSVSDSISFRTASKSVNFLFLQCRNSAYSETTNRNIEKIYM